MKLKPDELSTLTLRILAADGLHVFDCSGCGESKIGPVDRSVCLTCDPPAQKVYPLKSRKRGPKGYCAKGHEVKGENVYRRPSGVEECRICQRVAMDAYNARRKQRRINEACQRYAESRKENQSAYGTVSQ